jgi:thiamine biosynthesis lipoprotein
MVAGSSPPLVGTAQAKQADQAPPTERVSQTQRLMGVPWTITVYAETAAAGRAAIAAGFAEAARLERVLSDYDPESELSRLSATAPTADPQPVSADLWRVLERAVEIRDATDGAFDPTVGPLTTLWRQARRTGRLPLADKLTAARAAVGPQALRLAREAHAVRLTRPAMRLDLGGIGMGYAVDRVIEVLGRHGIASAMVDASGDIGVSAAPPGTNGWRIALAPLRPAGVSGAATDPVEYLLLSHAAVTTSGDAFQAVEIDGRRYSHIVDPRTGLGVAGPAAVTVVAGECTTADALATAASVLGPERALPVIAREPGCAARFVWMEDVRVLHSQTARWSSQPAQTAR